MSCPHSLRIAAFLAQACSSAVAQEPAANSGLTALIADTVLDGKGAVLHNTTIIVSGTKIIRVGGPVPKGATIYNLKKFTVTPGFVMKGGRIFENMITRRQ